MLRDFSHSHSQRPRVSVIVPSYNYAHFLPHTLRNVQSQSCADWECIIVDDGSTDDTAQCAQSFAAADPRIRYVRQTNRGLSAARNTGLRHCRGDYVQFLDADDWIESHKLEKQADYLDRNPDADLVYGSMRFFPDSDPTRRLFRPHGGDTTMMPEISGPGESVLPVLIRENIMVVNCPLIRRSAIEEVGFFDEELRSCEDWHYWILLAASGKYFAYEPMEGTLALVRMHGTSMSRNFMRMLGNALLMRCKLVPVLRDPVVAKVNNDSIAMLDHWLDQINAAMRELRAVIVGESQRYLLVDEDQINCGGVNDPRAMIFPAANGQYAGPPPDDEALLREFHRAREAGDASFIVFAWPAFWWLDYYEKFAGYLRANFRCVLSNERLIAFNLRERP